MTLIFLANTGMGSETRFSQYIFRNLALLLELFACKFLAKIPFRSLLLGS